METLTGAALVAADGAASLIRSELGLRLDGPQNLSHIVNCYFRADIELLRDVSFHLTPVTDVDAGEMIDRFRARNLLDGYRGMPPGDRVALVDVIMRVSALVEVVRAAGARAEPREVARARQGRRRRGRADADRTLTGTASHARDASRPRFPSLRRAETKLRANYWHATCSFRRRG